MGPNTPNIPTTAERVTQPSTFSSVTHRIGTDIAAVRQAFLDNDSTDHDDNEGAINMDMHRYLESLGIREM